MRRGLVWLQLLIGWLPMWAMFAVFMLVMHDPHGEHVARAFLAAFRLIGVAALLAFVVQKLLERVPWPHPFRFSFLLVHVAGAIAYSGAWALLSNLIESAFHGRLIVSGAGLVPLMLMGTWLYVMVIGVSYATRESQRAALAEATAARAQLAALRSQINPHFLFNALHTVVQLIPAEPRRAADAAERLGGLLRLTIEEDRDLVTLSEERAFVERYLEMEQLRFGDRLRVHIDVPDEAADAVVPSFALLTLVENAVRHGAESSIEPVDVHLAGRVENGTLTLVVRDTGTGSRTPDDRNGTGLRRLEERLKVLYGRNAHLDARPDTPRGFVATLTIPREHDDE